MSASIFYPTTEQETIICHDGSAFVIACPGAGKTRVLVERARQLFRNMPTGRGVAFLSFTESAIFELEARMRTDGLLPSPIFPSFVGTFDSFVWQFLVAPFGAGGSAVRPRLIADLDDFPVAPYDGAQPLPMSCFHQISNEIDKDSAKRAGFDVTAKPDHQIHAYSSTAKRIRHRWKENGLVSFDGARSIALQNISSEHPLSKRISSALKGRFVEVIVDEAQDCNPDDLKIISWLRESGIPIKVVCDPNQAIYKFRGGVTDHLFAFGKTFKDNDRMDLTGNFRSTPNICKAIKQFRPDSSASGTDEPLGELKDLSTPVYVLSYSGRAVPASIGENFFTIVKELNLDVSSSPIIAATKASGAAAAGQPRPSRKKDRSVRLAEAVTSFHFAAGFSDMKDSIDSLFKIILEIEGQIGRISFRQYIADNDILPLSWRGLVVGLLQEFKFCPDTHKDGRGWHNSVKCQLEELLTIESGQTISQKLRWNAAIDSVLAIVPVNTALSRTIHSVKGLEYPAVCVVTTSASLGAILDYLKNGTHVEKAEEARKLYVAASRAERLLVVAAPKSQANNLAGHLRGSGAEVVVKTI